MDEIADQANVSKPVLYQHFPSKLDLYLAVLDIHCDFLVADIRAAVASTKDNAGRVLATVNAYFDFINREGEAFRLLFESDMAVEPQVRERLNKMSYDCALAFSEAITTDTGISHESAMMLAVGLIGTAQTTARHWLAHDGKIDRDLAEPAVARDFRFPQNLKPTKLKTWLRKNQRIRPPSALVLARHPKNFTLKFHSRHPKL